MAASQILLMRKAVAAPSWYVWTRTVSVGSGLNDFDRARNTLVFNIDGTVSISLLTGNVMPINDFPHWHNGGTVAGIGNSRWIKRTELDNPPISSTISTTTPTALSTARNIAALANTDYGTVTHLLEIYSDSAGTTKVGEITLTQTTFFGS